MQERREHARYAIWFPVHVSPADATAKTIVAVSKDASSTGISISTASKFEVGEKVTVAFRVPPDTGAEQRVDGRIVRFAANAEDPHGLWPFRIAIAFDTPLPDLERLLAEVAAGGGPLVT